MPRPIALLALLAAAPAHAQTTAFDNLLQSRHVHCAFYKEYDVDRATGNRVLVEGRSETLTHFQGIHDGRARQITTRATGAREVRVALTGKYLHFIDSVAGMFVLTTVHGCINRDARGVCMTYGAMQSRHFDSRVLTDPDTVYESLLGSSDPGFCDHSLIGTQEARGISNHVARAQARQSPDSVKIAVPVKWRRSSRASSQPMTM